MIRPRAADDFAVIRARLHELRCERRRPRAADDFAVIHARLQELRGERAQARIGNARTLTAEPQTSAASSNLVRE